MKIKPKKKRILLGISRGHKGGFKETKYYIYYNACGNCGDNIGKKKRKSRWNYCAYCGMKIDWGVNRRKTTFRRIKR